MKVLEYSVDGGTTWCRFDPNPDVHPQLMEMAMEQSTGIVKLRMREITDDTAPQVQKSGTNFEPLLRRLEPTHPYLSLQLPGGGFESGHLHSERDQGLDWWYLQPKNGKKKHYFDPRAVLRVSVTVSEEG